MLPIPPEILGELALEAGSEVTVTLGDGHLRVELTVPELSAEAVEFMRWFMRQYDQALKNLADRWALRPRVADSLSFHTASIQEYGVLEASGIPEL